MDQPHHLDWRWGWNSGTIYCDYSTTSIHNLNLYIQVAYALGMGLDKPLTRWNGGAHEHIEGPIRGGRVLYGHLEQD